MLSVRELSKSFGDFSVRDVTFDVDEGDYFVLLGASGVGKTVLLETIAGLTLPDAGTVTLDGRDITRERIQRRPLGLVYQDQALFPHLSVRDNVAYGLRSRALTRTQVRQRVRELAERVGVTELLDRGPATLSGGEAQRVALARTLAVEPRCFLLDEPISSLDMKSRAEIRALLRRLNRAGHTMVHVTHDFEEAVSLASRIAIMEAGRIVQVGRPDEIFRHPKSEFVAHFVGIRNFLRGTLENPRPGTGTMAVFKTNGLTLHVVTEAAGGPGFLMVRREDVTLSNKRMNTSAQNQLEAVITDLAPTRTGIELTLEVAGIEFAVLVTPASVQALGLACDRKVWASFKATAARFIEE